MNTDTSEIKEPKTKVCPRCGSTFACLHSADCWCAAYTIPDKLTEHLKSNYNDCLCKTCLEELLEQY